MKWHITTDGKNANGISGKRTKKRYCESAALTKAPIEEIRTYDRADFNFNRRFYRWTNDVAEYLEEMADRESQAEIHSVDELLDEIENETLYRALLTVDKRTLRILLLKMQGYSIKEIAPLVGLTTGAIYARLDHLRKKLKQFKRLEGNFQLFRGLMRVREIFSHSILYQRLLHMNSYIDETTKEQFIEDTTIREAINNIYDMLADIAKGETTCLSSNKFQSQKNWIL